MLEEYALDWSQSKTFIIVFRIVWTVPLNCCFVDCIKFSKFIVVFTARCTTVQSAVLRSHVICLSVHLSVRLSITLVDQDHIGWKSWKLIAWTISPNTFALRSPKAIHLLQGEHGEIWGRLEVGWENMAFWSTKVAISLKRLKLEEKLLCRAYRNSLTLFRTVPFPTPYDLLFSKIGGSQPPPQTSIAIISGMSKATDFKFVRYIHRVHSNKSPLKILEKRAWAYPGTTQIFWSTPYYHRNG